MSRRAIQAELVSTTLPVVSSLPMQTIATSMGLLQVSPSPAQRGRAGVGAISRPSLARVDRGASFGEEVLHGGLDHLGELGDDVLRVALVGGRDRGEAPGDED